MQTTVSPLWLSRKTVGCTKLACSIHNVMPILEMLLEQTAWPHKHLCGLRVNTRNHFHSKGGIALSSPLLTDKFIVVLIVSSYSLFHLLWLGPRASGRCTRLGSWGCFTWCSPLASTACALVASTCLCQSFWLRRSLQSGLLFFCLQLK